MGMLISHADAKLIKKNQTAKKRVAYPSGQPVFWIVRIDCNRRKQIFNMAKQTKQGPGYRDILSDVEQKHFLHVYLLQGEESYYIDKLTDAISSNALTEDEQAFNLTTIYATDHTDPGDIINASRRYPMMAERQVVIVKECQNVKKRIDELAPYLEKPSKTTVLVLSYKNGTVDGRKKIIGIIQKNGVVFNSPRLKDQALPSFVLDYLKGKHVAIDYKATMMLVENIGSDLSRLTGEIDKLCITLPPGAQSITPEHIEKNIGISKNYNVFELKNALISKDVLRANRIINFFCDNPKQNSPIGVIAVLFPYFAMLMQAHYSPDKTDQGVLSYLGLNSTWQLNDYKTGMRNYTAMKTMRVIGKLREADTMLKGVGRGNLSDADIMKELVFFILH